MALCQYCGKVEIAWHQHERKWIACRARRDADGNVVRAAVRSGTRTVMRPVADTAQPHYPVPVVLPPGTHTVPAGGSYCADWTPAKAAARPNRGRRAAFARAMGTTPAPAVISPPTLAEIKAEAERMVMMYEPPRGWTQAGAPGAEPVAIPSVATVATAAPKVAEPTKGEPEPLPEPETLLGSAAIAAWKRAEAAIRCPLLPTRVFLWGPPGTGKTELPWRIAQELGWAHVQQQMTEETPGTELTGHLIVQAGDTVWCDGTLGRAIRASHKGHVVYVIDEVGRASQDALSACLLALTNPESLRLTLRSGEVLAPNPAHWHVVATSNDEPKMLPVAVADRLHISVSLLAPHPDLIRSMTTAEARRLAASRAREYSIRALLTYDRLRAADMSLKDAARIVWEPEVAQSFMDAVKVERGRVV